MSKLTYQTFQDYSKCSKQADKFYEAVCSFRKEADEARAEAGQTKSEKDLQKVFDTFNEKARIFWSKWQNTKLYKTYGTVYCQILSDSLH